MDERAQRSLSTPIERGGVTGRRSDGRRRSTIDAADGPDEADLGDVLRAVATRLDAILADAGAATDPATERNEAIDAWSSAFVPIDGDASREARRRALATTVLKISASGSLDIVEEDGAATSDAPRGAVPTDEPHTADEPTRGEGTGGASRAGTPIPDEPAPDTAERGSVNDVDARLRTVRERLERRRALEKRLEAPRPRPWWRRIDIEPRMLAQRLVIGIVIVGASAVVSLLLT